MLNLRRMLQALKQPALGNLVVIKDRTSIDFFFPRWQSITFS